MFSKFHQIKPHISLKLVLVVFCFWQLKTIAQVDTTVTLTFDFNEHKIKEKDDKLIPKPLGTSLTYDRFGNKESAVQITGNNSSYLNLGTSKLLKSPNMSISLWVKMNERMYTGKGYEGNPILVIKNGPGFDYVNGIAIAYDCYVKRIAANSTKDSTEEITIADNDTVTFNNWYHLAVVCNNHYFAFYVNGVLKGEASKKFETKFLETDSVMIGHSASTKNLRFMRGVVDDINIFHRALSEKEILDLYHAPNPNEFKNFLNEFFKYALIVIGFVIIIIIILIRSRRALKRQKAQLELTNKISELELRVVKAQMNPHFISNCLVAIQDLVYSREIEKAGLYIAKFSFFLRQVLNYSDENYVTIAEELEVIKLYIELEQLRFNNEFKFELIIDDDVDYKEIIMPALITQPFVENAVWHGLLPLKNLRLAELTIRVLMRNNLPIIEIEDNGVGRDLLNPAKRKSKGTKLVIDKIESLNQISNSTDLYKIEIIDLQNADKKQVGTKIVIQLENTKE